MCTAPPACSCILIRMHMDKLNGDPLIKTWFCSSTVGQKVQRVPLKLVHFVPPQDEPFHLALRFETWLYLAPNKDVFVFLTWTKLSTVSYSGSSVQPPWWSRTPQTKPLTRPERNSISPRTSPIPFQLQNTCLKSPACSCAIIQYILLNSFRRETWGPFIKAFYQGSHLSLRTESYNPLSSAIGLFFQSIQDSNKGLTETLFLTGFLTESDLFCDPVFVCMSVADWCFCPTFWTRVFYVWSSPSFRAQVPLNSK